MVPDVRKLARSGHGVKHNLQFRRHWQFPPTPIAARRPAQCWRAPQVRNPLEIGEDRFCSWQAPLGCRESKKPIIGRQRTIGENNVCLLFAYLLLSLRRFQQVLHVLLLDLCYLLSRAC